MELSAALSALNATFQLTKAAIGMRDDAKIADATQKLKEVIVDTTNTVIAIQEKLLSIQEANDAIKSKCRQLEDEKAELHRHMSDRARYSLSKISEGVFALSINDVMQPNELAHYLCQPCMDNRHKKATLQRIVERYEILLVCPECKFKYPTGKSETPVI